MTERLPLATMLEASLPDYCQRHPLSPHQWQVCHHLLACRTEAPRARGACNASAAATR